MLGRWTVVVFAVALVLAGCAAPASHGPATEALSPLVFGAPFAAVASCDPPGPPFAPTCYEPSVAVDAMGRILVTNGIRNRIAVSSDGGASWKTVAPPSIPDGTPGSQSDVVLQTSESGRIYYTALVGRSPGGPPSAGIQVAWTDDAGTTWTSGVFQSPADLNSRVAIPDPQWLSFGQGDTVYLAYTQPRAGLWVARSDDAGKSWGGWTRAVAAESTPASNQQSGPGVVASDGHVFLPVGQLDTDQNTCSAFITTSSDKGTTWKSGPEVFRHCDYFPMLALDEGRLIATSLDTGGVFTRMSNDSGMTWSEPIQWAAQSSASPWTLAKHGVLTIAYFAGEPNGTTLHIARGTGAGPLQDVTVTHIKARANGATQTPFTAQSTAQTDYAIVRELPDSRLVTVWTDSKAIFAATTR